MSFKMDGFDKLQKDLKKMAKKSKEMSGTQNIPFDELFSNSFMIKHTPYRSFDELLEKGGFVVNTIEDFENIPDDIFDEHIRKTTKYQSWDKMQEDAIGEYVAKQLGFR